MCRRVDEKIPAAAAVRGVEQVGQVRAQRRKQPGPARGYVEFFKSARPVEAGGEILVPGEPERRSRARRLAEGVPLPDATWQAIRDSAQDLGVML